jgi:hypothetical protein
MVKTATMKKKRKITAPRCFAYSIVILAALFHIPVISYSQGCIPAKHIPPNMGTQNLSYLVDGQWEVGVSYRYLHSDKYFAGDTVWQYPVMDTESQPIMNAHTIDFFGRYSINHRWSLVLNVPLIIIEESFRHDDFIRHTISTDGIRLGDIRLSTNYWLIDPLKQTKGNVALGLGIKFPTGKTDLQDTYFLSNGTTELRDLDFALLPGDGGWGIILEAYWIQQIQEILSIYASGFYMFNPRNMNGSVQPFFRFPPQVNNLTYASVADQYNFRLGLNAAVSQFVFSLGVRIDGMPINDFIGESDGFRRPGNIVYLEPGLVWSNIKNTINFSVPVALHRKVKTSNYDASLDWVTSGGLADYLIFIGYTRRF